MNLENLRYKSSVTEMLGMLTGMVFGKVGGLGGIMRGMLGVMLQYLYGSWAITITGVFSGNTEGDCPDANGVVSTGICPRHLKCS